jgi:hypothetical protein
MLNVVDCAGKWAPGESAKLILNSGDLLAIA